jgi:drug/metabolite transporter (DMT)-like permease
MRSPFRFSWPLSLAISAWTLNYIALKLLYVDKILTASEVAFLRYLVMYAALVILCVINRESFSAPRGDWPKLLWFGFCSMGIYMFLFLEGMRWSDPAEGAILLNVSPIMTMLIAAGLKQERLKLPALGGAVLALVGVVLVTIPTLGQGEQKGWGYALLITAACVWAYCIVITKSLVTKYSPLRLMTLSMPGGFPIMLTYWLMRDHGRMPLTQISPLGWLLFLHVALLSGVMGFILFYRGIDEIGASSAALWMFFVPPLTALCQWLFTGKMLTSLQLVGLVVVLIGVATAQRFRSPGQLSAAPPEPA